MYPTYTNSSNKRKSNRNFSSTVVFKLWQDDPETIAYIRDLEKNRRFEDVKFEGCKQIRRRIKIMYDECREQGGKELKHLSDIAYGLDEIPWVMIDRLNHKIGALHLNFSLGQSTMVGNITDATLGWVSVKAAERPRRFMYIPNRVERFPGSRVTVPAKVTKSQVFLQHT